MTTDRDLYEKMYARQLAEGHDLETAMRFNKAATPEDFRRAFGESSDPRHQHGENGEVVIRWGQQVRLLTAAREAQKEARDAST